MFICASKKCHTTTGKGGPENHLVDFEGINYVMPQPEEEFHLETSNDENTIIILYYIMLLFYCYASLKK